MPTPHMDLGWGLVGPQGCWGRAGDGPWPQLTQTCPLQKERDLELAARIGQSLLKQNRSLTERNELLEEQLELAKEEVTAPGYRDLALAPVSPAWGPWVAVLPLTMP